ncbi:WhiB family transcriptional regulator [uncultured Jatrophihabitans sp.]|uniref:WhiB family transcriptional regulator n=1 Tax=uncultured Jatrophihabitans sp. TaxID=1610747 RepID=UPI0035CBC9EC
MAADPFTGALCRDPGADPHWWDHDATTRQRTIAVWFCRACPAQAACAAQADALGPAATGIWAGRYRPWHAELDTHDDTMTAFTAVFGRLYSTPPAMIEPGQLSLLDLMEA